MRRNTFNFLIDIISLLVMFGMVATGLVIRFVLPPGTGGRHGGVAKLLWGLGRHDWGDIHFWLAVGLGVLMLLHLALHWGWVCGTVRRFILPGTAAADKTAAKTRNLYGIVLLCAIVGIFAFFLWVASANVETIRGAGEHDFEASNHGTHNIGGVEIRGSMTLAEIELASGVTVAVILSELGLPDTVSADERLGRLRHQYGFEMSTVRMIVEQHKK